MHIYCLYWLMSTGLLLQSAFSDHVIHDWWNGDYGTNGGLAPIWRWGLISLPLSAHICLNLVVEYWPFVGICGCHGLPKLYQCVTLLLCFHQPPFPAPLPTYFLIYTGPVLMNSMKKSSKTSKNQSLSSYLPG